MTTATLSRTTHHGRADEGYGFRSVARMEWLKLRSVRSTAWVGLVSVAAMIGLAVLVLSQIHWNTMSAADRATFDPTNDSMTGLAIAQLAAGVLGVLVITGEFSSGMIRATFAAVPRRRLVLAAKAAVAGAVALVAGEILAFAAFAAGELALKGGAQHAALSQPGVLRAVLRAGAYPALIALIGLGLGALIQHTAGAICALVGVLFVLPCCSSVPRFRTRRRIPAPPDGELADRGQAARAHAVDRADLRPAVRVCDGRARVRGLGVRPP